MLEHSPGLDALSFRVACHFPSILHLVENSTYTPLFSLHCLEQAVCEAVK